MLHHPADGPRLKTLYVTQSTRKRRRRSSSKRQRRAIALFALGLVAAVGAGVTYRDKIGKRISKMITKSHPPVQMVRDVTIPAMPRAPAAPPVKQAENATVSQTQPAAAH